MCLPDSVALNQKRQPYVFTYISPIDDDNFSTTILLLSCLAASPPGTRRSSLSLSPVRLIYFP